MGKGNVNYSVLNMEDLTPNLLKHFNRYQETKRVLFLNKDALEQKEDYFIDRWDDNKKEDVIDSLKQCIAGNGAVIGAFEDSRLIGFANVEGMLFGSIYQYVELPYIHVSNEVRGMGIGKKLFHYCCLEAEKLGADKLYIAAHPSVETQAFYKRLGCILATEINLIILAKEPLDIQLEKHLH
ncbi:GNAT family N-acetyltransferase [Bacillus sp. NEB1478]|uniref:GNAT family N-acetyltransferase n=1 Tax=Bacillus sp. NEB1478 TaxID=3073816 RepID=UPI002873F361|nr:GNAT family N-acetyltransferase [Bacillus sp. NEB1478]WNB92151.1 GNAT family N-acetyltransferase [Bacillus sp. NEB1478]